MFLNIYAQNKLNDNFIIRKQSVPLLEYGEMFRFITLIQLIYMLGFDVLVIN